MKRINLSLSLISVLIILSILSFTVYAVLNVGFTISNRIMFTSTGVYYKAVANVYLLSEEELGNYDGDIEAIVENETAITETYTSDNSWAHNDSMEWVIPDGDLRFTSARRYLVYIINIENHTSFDINVSISLPATNPNPYFDDIIENTPSTPIDLLALDGATVSSGTIYLVTRCIKIHNSFNLQNSFDIQLTPSDA
ncbi:MAG: hypothetical protein PHR96_04195 [Clostridia bacterium]|nr:hypothetical protein [Clostridia bacterium]